MIAHLFRLQCHDIVKFIVLKGEPPTEFSWVFLLYIVITSLSFCTCIATDAMPSENPLFGLETNAKQPVMEDSKMIPQGVDLSLLVGYTVEDGFLKSVGPQHAPFHGTWTSAANSKGEQGKAVLFDGSEGSYAFVNFPYKNPDGFTLSMRIKKGQRKNVDGAGVFANAIDSRLSSEFTVLELSERMKHNVGEDHPYYKYNSYGFRYNWWHIGHNQFWTIKIRSLKSTPQWEHLTLVETKTKDSYIGRFYLNGDFIYSHTHLDQEGPQDFSHLVLGRGRGEGTESEVTFENLCMFGKALSDSQIMELSKNSGCITQGGSIGDVRNKVSSGLLIGYKVKNGWPVPFGPRSAQFKLKGKNIFSVPDSRGEWGGALQFDGNPGTYASVEFPFRSSEFTLSIKAKFKSFGTGRGFFSNSINMRLSSCMELSVKEIKRWTAHIVFSTKNETGEIRSFNGVGLNWPYYWHHHTIRFSSRNITTYIDGKQVGIQVRNENESPEEFTHLVWGRGIGEKTECTVEIESMCLFNRALSDSEIAALAEDSQCTCLCADDSENTRLNLFMILGFSMGGVFFSSVLACIGYKKNQQLQNRVEMESADDIKLRDKTESKMEGGKCDMENEKTFREGENEKRKQ